MRAIVAVVAGFLVTAVSATVVDGVLHATGVFPPFGQPMSGGLFAVALAYRTLFTIAGGWTTARIATPWHGRVLAILGVVGGSLGIVAWVAGGPEMGPLWYPVALLVTGPPAALLGAALVSPPPPAVRVA